MDSTKSILSGIWTGLNFVGFVGNSARGLRFLWSISRRTFSSSLTLRYPIVSAMKYIRIAQLVLSMRRDFRILPRTVRENVDICERRERRVCRTINPPYQFSAVLFRRIIVRACYSINVLPYRSSRRAIIPLAGIASFMLLS